MANLQKMKPAEGRLVQDAAGVALAVEGALVDLDDPFWHRRKEWGDIVEATAAAPSKRNAKQEG